MSANKKTSSAIASNVAKTLKKPDASKIQKELAASALAQSNTNKQTGKKIETIASKALKSSKYSEETKSLAGSVLSQSNSKN